jgi:hypothetical protein
MVFVMILTDCASKALQCVGIRPARRKLPYSDRTLDYETPHGATSRGLY